MRLTFAAPTASKITCYSDRRCISVEAHRFPLLSCTDADSGRKQWPHARRKTDLKDCHKRRLQRHMAGMVLGLRNASLLEKTATEPLLRGLLCHGRLPPWLTAQAGSCCISTCDGYTCRCNGHEACPPVQTLTRFVLRPCRWQKCELLLRNADPIAAGGGLESVGHESAGTQTRFLLQPCWELRRGANVPRLDAH
jgi:hypothetical protein